jgi:anti-anti-sigma regulatory factor
MSEVIFLDWTGISALVELRNTTLEQDRSLVVANPSHPVRRLLELIGMDHVSIMLPGID